MQVHWKLVFQEAGSNGDLESVTHDLSSEGFYCIAGAAFVPGEIRPCTLAIPTHHRNGGDPVVRVQCKVRVIRVEALADSGMYGIGCRIEDYRFINPTLTGIASVETQSGGTAA
jgi:hypothetical protein